MFLEHDLVSVCCDVNSPAAFSLVLLLIVLKKVSRRCCVVLVVARVGTTGDGLPGRNPLDVAFGLWLQNSNKTKNCLAAAGFILPETHALGAVWPGKA